MAIQRDQIIEDAKKLAADVAEYVGSAGLGARERADELKKEAVKQVKHVDELARENVWVTAGIAAAVGAVIGLFLSRGKRD